MDTPTMECDACGKFVSRHQIKSATAYGIEGDFCAECRGEELEEEETA